MARVLVRLASATLFVWLALAGISSARCVGANLVESLRAEDPAGIAGVFERSHAVPNAQGRFWRVERSGVDPSHLFGTFHSPEVIDSVSEAVWTALTGARIAIFEIDLDQQAAMEDRMASDPNFAFDLTRMPLSQTLPPEQYAAFAEAVRARGLMPEATEQMRPWLLLSLMGFPACHFQLMAAGAAPLDKVMAERAERAGVPVTGLETFQDGIAAFERVDERLIMDSIGNLGALFAIEEDLFRTNADLYAAGEITAINEFSIWLGDRMDPNIDNRGINTAVMTEVLDVRNRLWLAKLEEHLETGNAFIGVGALHLPGNAGVIELLRARGWRISRLD